VVVVVVVVVVVAAAVIWSRVHIFKDVLWPTELCGKHGSLNTPTMYLIKISSPSTLI
jgi:hypothetical protein